MLRGRGQWGHETELPCPESSERLRHRTANSNMPSPAHSPVSSSSTTPICVGACARLLADLGADVRRIRHADDDGPADRFRNARKQPVAADQFDLIGVDICVENHGSGRNTDAT